MTAAQAGSLGYRQIIFMVCRCLINHNSYHQRDDIQNYPIDRYIKTSFPKLVHHAPSFRYPTLIVTFLAHVRGNNND